MSTNAKIVLFLILGLLVGGVGGYVVAQSMDTDDDRIVDTTTNTNTNATTTRSTGTNTKELKLYTDMRKLWADHVFWTREYVASAIDNQPDATQAATRLLKNQEDLGAAIVPYYGQAAGDRLTSLLKEHITIAVDIVTSTKANDRDASREASERWTQNADRIASFLADANPNLPEATISEAMSEHLRTTTEEVGARLNKDYARDVRTFDAVFDHINRMSDALSAAIIKQFPEKFR